MLSDGSMGFCFGEIPGQAGDDVEGLAGEIFGDAFDVGVDDGLFAGSTLQILQVRMIVHEEVLCEDCGAEGVAEDVEVFFPVRVGVVCSDASVWEVLFCSFVEAFGKFVGRCLPLQAVCEDFLKSLLRLMHLNLSK